MNVVNIVKAPTGFGKTMGYIKVALAPDKNSKIVCAPTNDLKEQIYRDAVLIYGTENIMQTPVLGKIKTKEIKDNVEKFDKMGLFCAKKKYLAKMKKALEGKNVFGTITEDEKSDLYKIIAYLDKNKLVSKFEGHVICTHERFFYFSKKFYRTHEPIIDEDILKTMLKVTRLSMSDIQELSSSSVKLREIFNDRVFELAYSDYEKTTQLKPLNTKQNIIEKEVKDEEFDFDVMGFVNACCYWKYNSNQEIMEEQRMFPQKRFTIPPNSTDEIYFLEKRDLPTVPKITIFSATANENLYKLICFGEQVNVYDVGDVEIKGKIIQNITNTCSRYDLKMHEERFDEIIKKHPDIPLKNVITFIAFSDNESDMHFGNTEGKNDLTGEDILVIGTPHCNEAVYKLYAYALTTYQDDFSKEQIRYQEVEYHNCKFWFTTYNSNFLREIQFWYINSELEQAVGRARVLRNDCTVYLYSTFPIKQAIYVNDKEIITSNA